ncbi:MAG: hypothetical protein CMO26_09020 [Thiotrichales bacterium]|nr:hypothetical protein [Thiotrichales bacterium]
MSDLNLPQPGCDFDVLIEDFETHGYCLIDQALDADTLAVVSRRLFNQAEAERELGVEFKNPGHLDNQWVNMLINKGEVFQKLVTHPLASRVIESALGPEYLLSCCDAQIKHPGSDFMPLHTDQWWMPEPQTPGRLPERPAAMARGAGTALSATPTTAVVRGRATVNIMWLITDFTTANGATVIVPGSHISGREPDSSLPHQIKTLAVEAPAGTALVFDGRLWHAAGANYTGDSRYGITCTFCGPQFRPLENYTLGLRPEVRNSASDELLRLLGFKAWSTYGHTGDPSLAVSVSGEHALGVMGEDS